jgi:hypothetical protein
MHGLLAQLVKEGKIAEAQDQQTGYPKMGMRPNTHMGNVTKKDLQSAASR